jgi:hypothetical protein
MSAHNGESITRSANELHPLFTIGVLAFFLLPDSPRRNTTPYKYTRESSPYRYDKRYDPSSTATRVRKNQVMVQRASFQTKASVLSLSTPLYLCQ